MYCVSVGLVAAVSGGGSLPTEKANEPAVLCPSTAELDRQLTV